MRFQNPRHLLSGCSTMFWDGLSCMVRHGSHSNHIPCPFKGGNWKMLETLQPTSHWSELNYMTTPHYKQGGKMYSLAGLLCAQLISEERIHIQNNQKFLPDACLRFQVSLIQVASVCAWEVCRQGAICVMPSNQRPLPINTLT